MDNKKYKTFLNHYASKTAFTLLSVIAAAITIVAFVQEKSVNLSYEITSNTNVLDFNADISKLDVFYDSTNLKQNHENLRIYTVKVINTGNKDIIKEYYDANDPIGIRINTGCIIEAPELIKTSSDYLRRNLKVADYQKTQIKLSQVILESDEYFIFKLLVLHNQDTIPNILSIGKIAGQKEIIVENTIDIKKDISFINRVYGGNILVQILRTISYFIGIILIIAFIVIISQQIERKKKKKKHHRLIKKFKDGENYKYTRMDDAIFDRYQESGVVSFKKMQKLIEDEEELNSLYNILKEVIKSAELKKNESSKEERYKFYTETEEWAIINKMFKDGTIFKDNNKIIINQSMKSTLTQFISFLEKNGEFKNRSKIGSKINTLEDDNE